MLEINKIYNMDCIEGLKQIEDNSVDCVITDPPYGISYHSDYYKNGNPHKPIENDDKLFLPLDELWRVVKPNGCIYAFYSHKVPLLDKRIKNVIIWVKNNWSAGDLTGDFANQYECIAFIPKEDFKLKSRRYSNVWNFNRVNDLKHPTQKPIALIRQLIETCTELPEELILDPFMGSGTTALAAKQMGMDYIGFETDSHYIKIAEQRLAQKTMLSFGD